MDELLGDDLPAAADHGGGRLPGAHIHPDRGDPLRWPPDARLGRAWLDHGGEPSAAGAIVQECGAGLVELRQDRDVLSVLFRDAAFA